MSKRASLILSIISVLGFGIVGGMLLSICGFRSPMANYISCAYLIGVVALKFFGFISLKKSTQFCLEETNSEKNNLWLHPILAILYLACNCLSIDYSLTRICKESFYGERENRKTYIIRQNVLNLLVSIILLIIYCASRNEFIRGIITIRLISRTMEINLSFFCDIISKQDNKKSKLIREERIKLALFSFVEEIILFFSLYSAILGNDCESVIKKTFSFLFVEEVKNNFCLQCALAYQKFCTFIIITLSLVTYVSSSPSKSDT